MLYRQGWQGGPQGFRPLVLALTGALVLLASCVNGNREYDEAEHSAFGEYVYALDTLQMEQCLTHLLNADTLRWAADDPIHSRYASIGKYENAPLWFSRLGVSSQADTLLSFLHRELSRHGLDSAAFFLPQIAADLEVVHKLAFDSVGQSINEVLPRLDYLLSKAYARYTVGQRYGFVRPDKMLNRMDYKTDGDGYARLFDYEVKAPDYDEPVRKLEGADRMDYLFQSQPADPLYQTLQKELTAAPDQASRQKIAVNMERCRWQVKRPDGPGRYILVNIPALQLWAVGGDTVLDMRICCGAYATKTPLLQSEITHLQVNPDWIIPQSIVNNEVSAHGGDSAYFARHRYYIVDRQSGDTLDPAGVTGAEMRERRFRIGQKGGVGNSLGRIVFRFPNNFGVYLHDTNNRGAFQRERRTLSHGCVRVQKPFDLACFLLPAADEWTLDRIRLSMDFRPQTERGRQYLIDHAGGPRPLRLMPYHDVVPRVPVFINYYTVYPNPKTGSIEQWPDLYGYDKVISREMKQFLPQ